MESQYSTKDAALYPAADPGNPNALRILPQKQGTPYDFPDKSIATGFELCNSTLAGPDSAGSACCTAADICTTGGYCLNNQYYPYRGACKSWNSGNCASDCLDGEPFGSVLQISGGIEQELVMAWQQCSVKLIAVSIILAVPFRSVAAVPCGDSGNYNGEFCCQLEQTTSCCNATFGNVFERPFAPVTLAASTVNGTSGTLGVPLGLLLLLSLVFAAWTERRRRRDLERLARETGWSGGQWDHEKSHVGSQAYGRKGLRHEAGGGKGTMAELADEEVYEAGEMF